jgi:hypothetical protein
MSYEFKCPHCGFINIRNGNFARIVCTSCGSEFIVTFTQPNTYHINTPIICPDEAFDESQTVIQKRNIGCDWWRDNPNIVLC